MPLPLVSSQVLGFFPRMNIQILTGTTMNTTLIATGGCVLWELRNDSNLLYLNHSNHDGIKFRALAVRQFIVSASLILLQTLEL